MEKSTQGVVDVKGVGKETADSILTYAGQAFLLWIHILDAYCRSGYDIPKGYDELRLKIEKTCQEIYTFIMSFMPNC